MAATFLKLSTLVAVVFGQVSIGSPPPNGIGRARVVNNCDFQVSLWSVGGSVSGPATLAPKGGRYSEQFIVDPATGGKALKITRDADGLYTGKPQTIFAYNLAGQTVYYDLSSVFGDTFSGSKLVVSSAEASCPSIIWPSGSTGSQVKSCTANASVTLTLCAP